MSCQATDGRPDWVLSHWAHFVDLFVFVCILCFCFILHSWTYLPTVLWHCWLGHLTRKNVPNMTYNVFGGTLNLAQSNPGSRSKNTMHLTTYCWLRTDKNCADEGL